ncbi:MAG: DUF2703 domain-containing protein [Anaerolineales bacterium]|nr:DUF2703 domain-containing protein [Anaerolineales bacterium]
MSADSSCGSGCGCSSGLAPQTVVAVAPRQLKIEFLYLDLDVCTRCQGSEVNLEEALVEVSTLLKAAGIQTSLQKTHVQSLEQVQALGFVSSPTIRLNGQDIQLELKENACPSCSELSGTPTNCRIWIYQGQEYSVPPKEMIVDAILRAVYGGAQADVPRSPQPTTGMENLRGFFDARRQQTPAGGQPQESTRINCCSTVGCCG